MRHVAHLIGLSAAGLSIGPRHKSIFIFSDTKSIIFRKNDKPCPCEKRSDEQSKREGMVSLPAYVWRPILCLIHGGIGDGKRDSKSNSAQIQAGGAALVQ